MWGSASFQRRRDDSRRRRLKARIQEKLRKRGRGSFTLPRKSAGQLGRVRVEDVSERSRHDGVFQRKETSGLQSFSREGGLKKITPRRGERRRDCRASRLLDANWAGRIPAFFMEAQQLDLERRWRSRKDTRSEDSINKEPAGMPVLGWMKRMQK